MTTRLIVPLDQSSVAESVLPLARRLASQLGAAVTLVSVIDVPDSFAGYVRKSGPSATELAEQTASAIRATATPPSPYGTWSGWSNLQPSQGQVEEVANETAAAERYLRAIADTFDAEHVETLVRLGQPAERILDLAERRQNPMIVLASHGRSGIGRAVLGSVAVRIVQGATCPVMVMRASESATGHGQYRQIQRILVPVDGSTHSERAVPVVAKHFASPDTRVHLLNVVDTPRFANKAHMQEYVRWLADQVSEKDIVASWEVTEGAPSRQIIEVADRHDADLIALSTHGRTGIDRFVLGSVAERILHISERPLLLIPARVRID